MAEAETVPVVIAPLKSMWWSKVNWTQVVGAAASILVIATGGKVNLSLEMQLGIVAVIQGIQSLATIIIKTYFTPTVTPMSARRVDAPKGTAVVVNGVVVTGHIVK